MLAHDENPVVGIGDVDEEGVVPLGNGQVANCDVSVSVQAGGRVGSGAPDRVVGIFADEAVFGEDVPLAALDSRRTVLDGDGLAGDGSRLSGGRTGSRLLLGKYGSGGDEKPSTDQKMLHGDISPVGGAPLVVGRPRPDDCRTAQASWETGAMRLL